MPMDRSAANVRFLGYPGNSRIFISMSYEQPLGDGSGVGLSPFHISDRRAACAAATLAFICDCFDHGRTSTTSARLRRRED